MRLSLSFVPAAGHESKIVHVFRGKRAVTVRAAKSLHELGLHNSQALQHMVGALIVRRAGPERYFLDEAVWASRRSMSGRSLWKVVLAMAFVVAAAAYYFIG